MAKESVNLLTQLSLMFFRQGHYVAPASLEFTTYTRLGSILDSTYLLCLLSAAN